MARQIELLMPYLNIISKMQNKKDFLSQCKIVNLIRQKGGTRLTGMLSVNGRISRDASCIDTTWLKRLELNVGDAFNRQISGEGESVDWSHVWLSEVGSREINEQEDEGESAFDQKIDLRSQNIGIGW